MIAQVIKIAFLVICYVTFSAVAGVSAACGGVSDDTPQSKIGGVESPEDASSEVEKIKLSLRNYSRSEDQTYLTLPEWYIVYSADEYATFLDKNLPSGFPYFRSIGQFWGNYGNVYSIVRKRYPFNYGYHLSNVVIGTSFSVETAIKGIYENIFGRTTEWLSFGSLTEEDAYARTVAKEYADFIHTIPWYEFPFEKKLVELWTGPSLWELNLIRKLERKISLSLEYSVKSIYRWLIKTGTWLTYAPEDLEIQAWVKNISDDIVKQESRIRIVRQINTQASIVAIPRYEAFTGIVTKLAREGVQFIDIAGNSEILVTAITSRNWEYNLKDGEFLFAMEILTQPDLKRVAVKAPVKSLHRILPSLESDGVKVEHIYDY